MKSIFKIVILVLLISKNTAAQTPSQKIPAFTFLKLDNSLFSNKDLESRKMLFFVFFDSECEHCQHAVKEIDQHYNGYKKTAIYLISADSPEKINLFMQKFGRNLAGKNNVTLLQDFNNEFITKFQPRKYPSLFLYSAKKELILYDDNELNLSRFLQQISTRLK